MVAGSLAALALGGVLEAAPELLTKLAVSYAERTLVHSDASIQKIRDNLKPYIEATFTRCSQLKTLLNPNSPANFLAVYATQRFVHGRDALDQYDLVDAIRKDVDNVIITGSGGSGKSMFTRYLWLSLFVEGDGRIPVFVELRNMNSVTSIELD